MKKAFTPFKSGKAGRLKPYLKGFTPLNKAAKRQDLKGFTLIELLVVIAIIGILAVIVIVSLDRAKARSRDSQREADLTLISSALENYKVEAKAYIISGASSPTPPFIDAKQDLAVPALYLGPLVSGGYIASIPKDPDSTSSSPLYYYYASDGAQFKLVASSTETIAGGDSAAKAGEFYDPNATSQLQISSTSFALNNWTYASPTP